MRIGVYGDSYAKWILDNRPSYIWWSHFKNIIPHCDVTSYGHPGSSIDYSLNLLLAKHAKYDFNIWCVTSCSRRSVIIRGRWYHFAQHGPKKSDLTWYPAVSSLDAHVIDEVYALFKHTWDYQDWRYKAYVDYSLKTISNLMVIPCFDSPLETGFCLSDISRMEWNHYFPDEDFSNLYKTYTDIRHGHITEKNQRILAELIAADLRPGLFSTDIRHFQSPDLDRQQCFLDI